MVNKSINFLISVLPKTLRTSVTQYQELAHICLPKFTVKNNMALKLICGLLEYYFTSCSIWSFLSRLMQHLKPKRKAKNLLRQPQISVIKVLQKTPKKKSWKIVLLKWKIYSKKYSIPSPKKELTSMISENIQFLFNTFQRNKIKYQKFSIKHNQNKLKLSIPNFWSRTCLIKMREQHLAIL